MSKYTEDQLLHLDLPEEFQGNFQRKKSFSDIPWDVILLGITIFYLMQDHSDTSDENY